MKKSTKAVIMLLTVVTMVTVLSGCDMFKKTNDGQVDLKWYMGLTYEDSNQNDIEYKTKVGSQVMAVALENDYAKEYAILKDVDAYIDLDVVKENIDKRFYWDKKDKRILFTNATTNYYIDKKDTVLHGGDADEDLGYVAFITEKKKCYVNTKFVQKFADCKINITKKSDKAPGIVSLDYTSTTKKTFTIDSDTQMRTKGDYQNLIVTDIKEGTKVTAIEQGKNWSKVKTESGYIGYVPTKELTNEENKKVTYKNDDDEYDQVSYTKKPKVVRQPKAGTGTSSKIVSMNSRGSKVYVIRPKEFNEAQDITDFLNEGKTIVINMEGIDLTLAQRIIDFVGGACYALDGSLQAISNNIFIAAPHDIEVTGDLREEILNESTVSPNLSTF